MNFTPKQLNIIIIFYNNFKKKMMKLVKFQKYLIILVLENILQIVVDFNYNKNNIYV